MEKEDSSESDTCRTPEVDHDDDISGSSEEVTIFYLKNFLYKLCLILFYFIISAGERTID